MLLDGQARSPRGMTLLELIVVMAILVAVIGVSIAGVSRLKSVRLRSETNRMAAAIRHTYNRAAAHGLYMRMVFDLDDESYWVEAADRPVFISKRKREEGEELHEKLPDPVPADEEEDPEIARARKRRAKYQEDGVIERIKFDNGIEIDGVLTSGQEDVFQSGRAYVHFFPQGFVEPALIYTTDGEGTYYTLRVNPLTGKVARSSGKIDPDRDFGQPDRVEEEDR